MEYIVEKRTVLCKNGYLEYELKRKKVKNINMRIKLDGRILISANRTVPAEFIDDFVREKQTFIEKALKKYEEKQKDAVSYPKEYIDGERIDFLGRRLRLKVTEGIDERICADESFLFLVVREKDNTDRKKKLLDEWVSNQQKKILGKIFEDAYQMFRKYHIPYPELRIRNMVSEWGSCRPQRGIITLNGRLIEVPEPCIEYVVLHEYAHFIHPDHSRRFYDFVEELMPDWRERKELLGKKSLR